MSDSTLEELILSQLSALSLSTEPDHVEFIQGVVEEDTIDQEDKKMAILGLLELDEDEAAAEKIDTLLNETSKYQEEQRAAKEAELAVAERLKKEKFDAELEAGKGMKLTAEQGRERKAALLAEYGYVEDEDDKTLAAKAEADKQPSVVFPDPRLQSKKARKKALEGVDILMLPNTNAAAVKGAELQRRNEDAAKAAAKRERDKNDLKKQKEDAAKKAADRTKRAAKVERRA